MAGSTDHFGLDTVAGGDKFSDRSFKYTNRDRQLIDNLLYLGTTGHRHNGDTSSFVNPTTGLSLTLDTTQGTIPAGTRVYYKYTLVDIVSGNETAASPEGWVETSQPLPTPNAPTLESIPGSGVNTAGNYYYVLSAYEDTSSQETLALNPNWVTLRSTGSLLITLPSLPTGATGFNIYRKSPGDFTYFFLATTTSDTYLDDGSVSSNPTRILPTVNTTNASNAVNIAFPGATPTVPDGFTWKLYRTYAAGNYQNSLVHHIVEETSSGSGIISPTYQDLGGATLTGEPPSQAFGFDSPQKIDLSDAAEVQNTLPPANVAGYPWQMTLKLRDFLDGTQFDRDVFPYPAGAMLGYYLWAETPSAGNWEWQLNVYHAAAATPTADLVWDVFETSGTQYDTQLGEWGMLQGDILELSVVSQDDGATPTLADVFVTFFGWAYFPTSTVSSSSPPLWQ